MRGTRLVLMGILLCSISTAEAQVTAAQKCEAAKLDTAGKYDFCRLIAEEKAAKKGSTPDFSKCDATYSSKWTKAESKAAGMCPSTGDETSMQTFITENADAIEAALDGGTLPEGVLSCNADLAICQAQPLGQRLQTGQTTCYDASGTVIACAGSGQDGELQKGLTPAYVDNGDGTVTDTRTGLMWEKLSEPDDGSIHDRLNTYTWANAFGKIATLNSSAFAGHTDWRLPNVNELQSLIDYGTMTPAVNTAFNTGCVGRCTVLTCSCTRETFYWSSTSYLMSPFFALVVDFNGGIVDGGQKPSFFCVRAVRGGS